MYQNMFKVAQEIALQKQSTGQVTPNDTICIICAASKRFYTGISHNEMQNGMMINTHAEIDAVQQMRAGGDTVAEYLLLISTATLQPILPCSGCIGFILGQAPENAKCQVVLPDRMIPIPQIGQMNGSGSMPFNPALQGGSPPQGSMYGTPPQGSMYGAPPQGSMYGAPPQGSMYGAPPQGSMYGQGSMYNSGSMPYNGAQPAGGSMYTSSMYGNGQGGHYGGGAARPKKSGGSMLKGKVGGLVNAGKDIGNDEPEESEFMKKLFKK